VALLEVNNLHKSFGGISATCDVSIRVEKGELHAIIGPNGAGKTTLISQLTGDLESDSGTVYLDGKNITRLPMHKRARLGMARSFQITSVIDNMSVIENVMLSVQAQSGHSFRFWQPVSAQQELTETSHEILVNVGLQSRSLHRTTELSHGERRQLEVAMALAMRPKLLLLDEPMAGMGSDESIKMIDFISSIKGGAGILLIEHDMDAVFKLADRISVLVEGNIIASGSPEQIRDDKQVRRAYLGDE
jgi:branched-chain amino acid transport system ATP-binding protein